MKSLASRPSSQPEVLESRIAPATLIGLDSGNTLLTFDHASPGTIAATTPVTGLGTGESLIGIDFRPATGALYGLTIDAANAGRLYVINPSTGVAAFSALLAADPTDSSSPYTALSGTNFGTDFNPVPDRLRVVSDTNQNLRINVDTGAVTTDSDLTPSGTSVAGAAYVNSFAGATGTTLYDIDVANDVLVLQTPPNNGVLGNVGTGLGVGNVTGVGGFDVLSSRSSTGTVTNSAFAALTVGGVTSLFSIDLTGGTATSLGAIGSGVSSLRGLTASIATPSAKAYTIDGTNTLLSFNTATPGVTTSLGTITGLGGGESIIGFDFRPADGQLYAVTKDGANAGRLYTINVSTAAATQVGGVLIGDPTDLTSQYTGLAGTKFGVDFNPFADRLRIVSDTGANLRVNPATNLVITDTDLTGGTATGSAYTNNFAGTTATALYDLDPATDTLYLQTPPNSGVLVAVGLLGVNATDISGFDIRTNGEAYATMTVGGSTGLYRINLDSGAATLVGAVGAGSGTLSGLAIGPSGSLQVVGATVAEDASVANVTINRVGGSEGTVSVLFNTTAGTATAGSDYTTVSKVVTFLPGETSKIVSVSIFNDALDEADSESLSVGLSDVAGGAVISTTSGTVTITDNDPAPVITIATSTLTEGNSGTKTMTFEVSLSAVSGQAVSVDYALANGTAIAGSDFVSTSGTLVIPAGSISGSFDVTINGDTVLENHETFTATLTNAVNASLGNTTATGTILNDDSLSNFIALGTGDNSLRRFDASNPNVVTNTTVTGLGTGETLVGIDYRPATGTLYGLTKDTANAGKLYVIDPATGAATFAVSLFADPTDTTAPYTSLSGTNFGVDFNPVPDRLRVVSDTLASLRINVDTGAVTTDGNIGTASAVINSVAYANSFAGAATTTLYDIDATTDTLYIQNTTTGALTAVGSGLGAGDITSVGGFDILSVRAADGTITNVGFATLTVGSSTSVYQIDLTTGFAAPFGAVGNGTSPVSGLTAPTGAPTVNAFTIVGTDLVKFNVATPNVTTTVGSITGLGSGQTVLGFDFRPADGQLYLLTADGTATGRLYTINQTTAAATLVGTLAADAADTTAPYIALAGTKFGVDFNPVADRLRVVSETGQNLRINVATGAVTTDDALNITAGTPGVISAGYTNSFAGATATELFDIDLTTNQLVKQSPPNNGTLTVVGSLGVTATGTGGFDITARNEAYATLQVAGQTGLYRIDTSTGAATLVGQVGSGASTSGLALAPIGSLQFNATAVQVDERAGTATLTIDRVGGSEGALQVNFATGNGSGQTDATAGADYTAVNRVITFAPGVTSQTVTIPLIDDVTVETNELLTATLSNGLLGANKTATVTITNDDATASVLPGGKSVSFLDVDGDTVTIKTTKGTFTAANVVLTLSGPLGGAQLTKLDLTNPSFIGANISFSVKRAPLNGDGYVHVGAINATNVALGGVSIPGDLGQIDAAGIKGLNVQSIGRFGLDTQPTGGNLVSTITGNLDSLLVKTNIRGGSINVTGNIGPVKVGGSIIGVDAAAPGSIVASGAIGQVTVAGDIVGAAAAHSGTIEAGGKLTGLTLGGTLKGGAGTSSGSVVAATAGTLKLRDIDGGKVLVAGLAGVTTQKAATVLTGLSVTGSAENASILVGYDRDGVATRADVAVGNVLIAGDWIGSNLAVGVRTVTDAFFGNDDDGLIPGGNSSVIARIASISVTGSLAGTSTVTTDSFGFVAEQIGAFKIGPNKVTLNASATPDSLVVGPTFDIRIREFIA